MADYDPGSSERVVGCDLFSFPIKAGTTDVAAGFSGGIYGDLFWQTLSPSVISTRLAAIEEMYQWYAIRRLKVHYVPTTGTGTVGSVAIGVATDADESAAFASPTQQQVLELNPAVLTPVWAMSTLEIQHRGTKLWQSFASGNEDPDTEFQMIIAASLLGGIAGTTYGQLWMEFEIDFYQQCPLLSAVDLFRLGKSCPRCAQKVLVAPERKEKPPFSSERKGSGIALRGAKSFVGSADREPDDYDVILRTQERDSPMDHNAVTCGGSVAVSSRPRSLLLQDERKVPSSTRAQSTKA